MKQLINWCNLKDWHGIGRASFGSMQEKTTNEKNMDFIDIYFR